MNSIPNALLQKSEESFWMAQICYANAQDFSILYSGPFCKNCIWCGITVYHKKSVYLLYFFVLFKTNCSHAQPWEKTKCTHCHNNSNILGSCDWHFILYRPKKQHNCFDAPFSCLQSSSGCNSNGYKCQLMFACLYAVLLHINDANA